MLCGGLQRPLAGCGGLSWAVLGLGGLWRALEGYAVLWRGTLHPNNNLLLGAGIVSLNRGDGQGIIDRVSHGMCVNQVNGNRDHI